MTAPLNQPPLFCLSNAVTLLSPLTNMIWRVIMCAPRLRLQQSAVTQCQALVSAFATVAVTSQKTRGSISCCWLHLFVWQPAWSLECALQREAQGCTLPSAILLLPVENKHASMVSTHIQQQMLRVFKARMEELSWLIPAEVFPLLPADIQWSGWCVTISSHCISREPVYPWWCHLQPCCSQ